MLCHLQHQSWHWKTPQEKNPVHTVYSSAKPKLTSLPSPAWPDQESLSLSISWLHDKKVSSPLTIIQKGSESNLQVWTQVSCQLPPYLTSDRCRTLHHSQGTYKSAGRIHLKGRPQASVYSVITTNSWLGVQLVDGKCWSHGQNLLQCQTLQERAITKEIHSGVWCCQRLIDWALLLECTVMSITVKLYYI